MLTTTPAERITGIILIVLVPTIIATFLLGTAVGFGFDIDADDFREEVQDLADNQARLTAQAGVSFLLAAVFITAAAARSLRHTLGKGHGANGLQVLALSADDGIGSNSPGLGQLVVEPFL